MIESRMPLGNPPLSPLAAGPDLAAAATGITEPASVPPPPFLSSCRAGGRGTGAARSESWLEERELCGGGCCFCCCCCLSGSGGAALGGCLAATACSCCSNSSRVNPGFIWTSHQAIIHIINILYMKGSSIFLKNITSPLPSSPKWSIVTRGPFYRHKAYNFPFLYYHLSYLPYPFTIYLQPSKFPTTSLQGKYIYNPALSNYLDFSIYLFEDWIEMWSSFGSKSQLF